VANENTRSSSRWVSRLAKRIKCVTIWSLGKFSRPVSDAKNIGLPHRKRLFNVF